MTLFRVFSVFARNDLSISHANIIVKISSVNDTTRTNHVKKICTCSMISITPTIVLSIVAVLAVVVVVFHLVYGHRAENTHDSRRIVPGRITKIIGDTVEFDYIVDKKIFKGTLKKLKLDPDDRRSIYVTIATQNTTPPTYEVITIEPMSDTVVPGKIIKIEGGKVPRVTIRYVTPTNNTRIETWDKKDIEDAGMTVKLGETIPLLVQCETSIIWGTQTYNLERPVFCGRVSIYNATASKK